MCDEGTEYGTPFLMNNKKKEKGKTTLFKVRLKCPEDSSCSFCRHIMMDEEKQTWKIETPPLESQRVGKGKKKNGYEHNDSCKLYEKYSYNTPQRITKKWRDLKPKTQVENQEDGNSTEEEPVEVSEEQTNHLFQIKLVERAKEKEFYKITKKAEIAPFSIFHNILQPTLTLFDVKNSYKFLEQDSFFVFFDERALRDYRVMTICAREERMLNPLVFCVYSATEYDAICSSLVFLHLTIHKATKKQWKPKRFLVQFSEGTKKFLI